MESARLKVRVTFKEEILGMESGDPKLHETYIASKAPNAKSKAEEVEALGEEGVVKKEQTVFPKDKDGTPFLWDYQIRGFFKDACGMLRNVPGTESAGVKAYKKFIDGLIFIDERRIPIHFDGEMGDCQRPLRASTPQGERIAIANSETCPAGSWIEFTVNCLIKSHMKLVREWLDYGALRGMCQWRNSGKGRFTWEEASKFDWEALEEAGEEKKPKGRRKKKDAEPAV